MHRLLNTRFRESYACMDDNYTTHIMNSVNNSNISIIPVANLKFSTATSQRSLPLKRQIIILIEIGGEEYDLKLYIVPKLSHNVILGINKLNAWKATILLQDKKLLSIMNNGCTEIPFLNTNPAGSEKTIELLDYGPPEQKIEKD